MAEGFFETAAARRARWPGERVALVAAALVGLIASVMTVASAREWPFRSLPLIAAGVTHVALTCLAAVLAVGSVRAPSPARAASFVGFAVAGIIIVSGALGIVGNASGSGHAVFASAVAALGAGALAHIATRKTAGRRELRVASTLLAVLVAVAAGCTAATVAFGLAVSGAL